MFVRVFDGRAVHKSWTGGGLDFYIYIFPLVCSVKPLFRSCPKIPRQPDRPGLIATETIKNDSKLNVLDKLCTIIYFALIFSPPPPFFSLFGFVFTLRNDISEHGWRIFSVWRVFRILRVRDQTGRRRIVGNTNQREGIIRISRLYLLCWMYIWIIYYCEWGDRNSVVFLFVFLKNLWRAWVYTKVNSSCPLLGNFVREAHTPAVR